MRILSGRPQKFRQNLLSLLRFFFRRSVKQPEQTLAFFIIRLQSLIAKRRIQLSGQHSHFLIHHLSPARQIIRENLKNIYKEKFNH